jgi:hypothetical protein
MKADQESPHPDINQDRTIQATADQSLNLAVDGANEDGVELVVTWMPARIDRSVK